MRSKLCDIEDRDGSALKHGEGEVRTPTCVSQYTKTPCVHLVTHAAVYLERYAKQCDMTVCRGF
jgi:hypothetical protein